MVNPNADGSDVPPIVSFNVMGTEHKLVAAASDGHSSLSLVSSDDDDEEIAAYDNQVAETQEPTINVINSRDVVIGSVTQFHGPVTIVQHTPSTQAQQQCIKDKEAEQNNAANLVTSDTIVSEKVRVATCIPKRILICFAFITLLVVIIALSLIYSLSANISEAGDSTSVVTNVTEAPPTQYIGRHKLISRSAWGARDPTRIINMTLPAEYVIISHTAGSVCKSFVKCSVMFRNIQNHHVATIGSSDIGYNFIIAGDGSIYYGRGWTRQNFHEDRSVGICFTGNFIYDHLTDDMEDALIELLKVGVKKKYLAADYKLIAHNQTFATLSPGTNLYSFIKTLPHFYPERIP